VNYFKEKILPSLLTAILLAILTAVIKIYLVVDSLPNKFNKNDSDHVAMQKQVDELKAEVKSLQRRVTNNQTEIFYLIMNKPKPTPQNN